MLMRGWACRNAPPEFKNLILLWYKREGKQVQMTNICSSRHTLLYIMKTTYFTGPLSCICGLDIVANAVTAFMLEKTCYYGRVLR